MTDEQAQRVIEMWVGCYDVADIAVSTGLTPFEIRAEINRVWPPDHGQTFLIPPDPARKCRECKALVAYAGVGRPAERCNHHNPPKRRPRT